MLKTALEVAVLAFVLTAVVGLKLSADDFLRIARRVPVAAATTAGRVVLRPTKDFAEISLAVAVLTGIIFFTVWAAGWACALPPGDRFALATEFVVRDVGIATAVAVTALGRTEFAVLVTAYFLVQTPPLLAALGVFRRSQAPATARRG
jgi:hypothetical protein